MISCIGGLEGALVAKGAVGYFPQSTGGLRSTKAFDGVHVGPVHCDGIEHGLWVLVHSNAGWEVVLETTMSALS